MRVTLSLGQIDVLLGQPERNLAKVRSMTAEAAQRGSDLVVFPELWSTGYDLEHAARYATSTDQGIFAEAAGLARQHNIHFLGSCLSLVDAGQYANTAVLFSPRGEIVAEYSKIHLFRLMEEERYLTAGDRLAVAETPWGTVGLSICYDLRFPEQFRLYASAGARVVLVPAEWPHPRLPHWQTLLRARAIENQYFVVGCNRVGSSKGADFFGHSTVIDPWGEPIVEAGEHEILLTAEIDLSDVEAVRETIPVFRDRRTDLYHFPVD